MTAGRLLLDLLNDGAQFWVEAGDLRFRAPKGALAEPRRAALRECKPQLLSLVGTRGRMAATSFAQQRLWLFDRLVPGSCVYNIPEAIRWQGPLEVEALRGAFAAVIERHETLRTTFGEVDGYPVQIIAPAQAVDLPVIEFGNLPAENRERQALQWVRHETRKPFDLSAGPLLRLALLRLGEQEHILVVTMHHIVADGWSMGILVRDVTSSYRALANGQPCPLPHPPIQYADYAHWQAGRLSGEWFEPQLAYWRKRLDGASGAFELPTPKPRLAVQSFKGSLRSGIISAEIAQRLRALAQREQATLFIVMLAAFKGLLALHTGRHDVIVGSPVAGRNHAQVESLIGFFINILVLRTDLAGDPTFRQLVARVRETTLEAYAHQDLPAERIAEALHLHRDRARPLIPVAFVLQNTPGVALEMDGLRLTALGPTTDTAKVDLTVFVRESGDAIETLFEYSTDLFDEATIAALQADYLAILGSLVTDPDLVLSKWPQPKARLAAAEPARLQPPTGLAAIYEQSNLTMNQLLVWSGQKLQRDVPIYNIAGVCTLRGEIDPVHFREAFHKLVASCDALRTVVHEVDGIPVQSVLAEMPAPVEMLNWSDQPDASHRVEAWARQRCQGLFDIASRMFDCALVKTAPCEYAWYFCHHHLITDGWSYMLILRQMSDFYERSVRGELDAVQALPSFQEYVAQERQYRKSPRFAKDKQYWEAKFAEPVDEITFYGRPTVKRGSRVERLSVSLGAERSERIKNALASLDTSLPMLFSVVMLVFLRRISGSTGVSIGVPFHNRRSRDLRSVVGLLMEAVLLRVRTDPTETFVSLLDKAKAEMFATVRHGSYAIGNPRHRHAYDIFLNYHATSADLANEGTMIGFAGATGSVQWIHTGHDFNSLAIHIHDFESTGALNVDFDFHCDVFDEPIRQRTIDHCLAVLDGMLDDPNRPIEKFSLLGVAEWGHLVEDLNATTRPYETGVCLHELVERAVDRWPNVSAVVFEGRSLSYAELEDRANRLANWLRREGVGPETLVGVSLERSLDLVVGLLAILKAGGAYVPLDPSYPPSRLAYMAGDSGVKLVLTGSGSCWVDGLAGVQRVVIEQVVAQESDGRRPHSGAVPGNLAYMIYTSGSTGQPKGALNEHGGIVNRLQWMQEQYRLEPDDRVLQKTPFGFDVSVWEFFWPLMQGATLVVAKAGGHRDAKYLNDLIGREGITTLHFVPSMLEVFLEEAQARDCRSLRRVICSGEALSWDLVQRFGAKLACALENLYGPTEAAVDVTYWPCDRDTGAKVIPIGYPVANTRVHILDEHLQVVPQGVAGEIYLGGIQVGRGYWGKPALTAEKFVPDPLDQQGGRRLYRTGDAGRYREDGSIEYLGRLDDQVKIRGFRVELGEIESRLREHAGVREAAVSVAGTTGSEKRLVGYIVGRPESPVDVASLRNHLRERLPEYMVPAAFVALDHLPLSPNGKLDRKALPAPKAEIHSAEEKIRVAPRNPLERQLVDMWEEMLGVRPIGVTDNFFDLGGHSLVAVRMISMLGKQSERDIPVAALFESPTIETLARILSTPDDARPASPLVPIQPRGDKPPFFCVHALFGSVLCFIELARSLGIDQPFFGLESVGLQGTAEPLTDIDAMAAAYIVAMRSRQPQGPYHIGGYSMGGVIAYEMARQLRCQRQEVASLVLFDSYTPEAAGLDDVRGLDDAGLMTWFLEDRGGWLSQHNPEMAKTLQMLPPEQRIDHLLAELQSTGHVPPHVGPDRIGRYLRVLNANLQAFHRYRPGGYDGRIDFFRSADGAGDLRDPLPQWRELCGTLRVHRVPGFHGTMLSQPHVRQAAEQLRACLGFTQGAGQS